MRVVPTLTSDRRAHPTVLRDAAAPRLSPELDERTYRLVVAGCVAAVAAFLALRLTAWPPHEDETLALFVGRESLSGLLDTVLGERGGAPLHFLAAWIVAHLGGGLTGLRAFSAACALASLPLAAALVRRLADRTVAGVATVLISASWLFLFHGVYGRMYSLFLLTSLLSYLALLAALEKGGRRAWATWVAAVLLSVASHPYGALVLGSQAVFVFLLAARGRVRAREAAFAFGAVGVLGIPFWITDLVLAGRFHVGVAGGATAAGERVNVVVYLGEVAGDASAGWLPALVPVLVLATLGARSLARANRSGALLVAAVVGTPAAALVVARFGGAASPETRHLIFALPFFAALVALGAVTIARSGRRLAAFALLPALVAAELAWGWTRTPELFTGEPANARAGREAAAEWLARTSREDDVLLGYEPVYLRAWQRRPRLTPTVVPRADPRLELDTLSEVRRPLGRGVWVLDATDRPPSEVRWRSPGPRFEARAFGPFLVVRTRRPERTPARFLRDTVAVARLGLALEIDDAEANYDSARAALRLLREREHGPPEGTASQ